MKKSFVYNLKKSKILYLSLFVVAILAIKSCINLNAGDVVEGEFVTTMYLYTISSYFITLVLFPTIIVLNDIVSDLYDNIHIISRFRDRESWWKEKAKYSLFIALVYAGIINLLILLILIFNGIEAVYLRKVVLALVFQIAGFTIVGLTYHIIKTFIKNRYIAMGITASIFISLLLLQYGFYYIKYVSVLQDYMNLSYMFEGGSTLVGLLTTFIILLILYKGGMHVTRENDFYSDIIA